MMLTSVLLILGVAYMANCHDIAKEKVFDYRVRSQQLHLDHLEEEIGKLEDEFEKLDPLPDQHDIKELRARVSNLETGNCGRKRHHECHGDPGHCVNDLHVCDGHKDCPNGGDEDDYTCNPEVIQPGRSYVGRATWESCIQHDPHNVIVTIAANSPAKYFGAFTFVRAVVTLELDEHHHAIKNFIGKGYYSFGNRLLALAPGDTQQTAYAVACKFNLGDNDHADCKILERVSLTVCARFRASRV